MTPSSFKIILAVFKPETTVEATPTAGPVQCPLKNRLLIGVFGDNLFGPTCSGVSAHPRLASRPHAPDRRVDAQRPSARSEAPRSRRSSECKSALYEPSRVDNTRHVGHRGLTCGPPLEHRCATLSPRRAGPAGRRSRGIQDRRPRRRRRRRRRRRPAPPPAARGPRAAWPRVGAHAGGKHDQRVRGRDADSLPRGRVLRGEPGRD